MEYFVHHTAIIDNGAKLGAGCKIWHWTHVSAGAVLGNACNLGQNVFIANHVTIGNNVKIQNNVSVYDNVVIEDDVFCGPSVVFTNVYNPRAEFVRKDEYKSTIIRKGATLGANCTLVCGVTIGNYAFIGAGCVVTKDVSDFALMVGNPARQVGWMSRYGKQLEFHDDPSTQICAYTGDKYSLNDGIVRLLE